MLTTCHVPELRFYEEVAQFRGDLHEVRPLPFDRSTSWKAGGAVHNSVRQLNCQKAGTVAQSVFQTPCGVQSILLGLSGPWLLKADPGPAGSGAPRDDPRGLAHEPHGHREDAQPAGRARELLRALGGAGLGPARRGVLDPGRGTSPGLQTSTIEGKSKSVQRTLFAPSQ